MVTLCAYDAYAPWDSGYAQCGELHDDHAGTIGVICHELGHDNGLPDLYDTTYASQGIGAHGVMGWGCWGAAVDDMDRGETPVHPCAWATAQLGFVDPTILSVSKDYGLVAAGSPSYNVLRVNTTDANQYFLLENRQLQGFDAGLYQWFSQTGGGAGGGGLAVWHIDESIASNDNAARKKVDLEEASAATLDTAPGAGGDATPLQGDRRHYYYVGNAGDFGELTSPSSQLYDGSPTSINVSSISAAGPTMKCFAANSLKASLAWSTYLGGASADKAYDLAIDPNENVYVAGDLGNWDVVKFDPNGVFVWGASIGATVEAIDVDSSGCAYVTGQATEWFMARPSPTYGDPPPYVYDYTYNGAKNTTYGDAHVTKIKADGSGVVYASFLGGGPYDYYPYWSGIDAGHAIAVDGSGQAVVTGRTNSQKCPDTESSAYGHSWDAFVTIFNAAGTGLLYSRYLCEGVPLHGYPGTLEEGTGVTCDASGNAWAAGWRIWTTTATATWATTRHLPRPL